MDRVSELTSGAVRRYERQMNEVTVAYNLLGESLLTQRMTVDGRLPMKALRVRYVTLRALEPALF